MMHAFALFFVICTASAADDPCEDGIVAARSCAAAEAYIRAGLRPDQTMTVLSCARRA